jgi:murein DD-endopeptidase MepM/ murein hydrolase activator NlpD
VIIYTKYRKVAACFIVLVLITVISVLHWKIISKSSDKVDPAFTMFNSEEEYLNYIKDEVSFDGVSLRMVEVPPKSNFWKIAREYGVNIDTLISANPFWENLNAKVKQTVVVPSKIGALHFISGLNDIENLCSMYDVDMDMIVVQNMPFYRKILSGLSGNKKPIAVFIQNIKPDASMMTNSLAKQFSIRQMFRSPLGGRYSSYFGRRLDPIVHSGQFHNGVDIAAPYGTPVGAACDGIVSSSGWMGGFGNAVIIEHRNGYRSLYGHMSSISVRQGQKIKAGNFVGRVGSTGWSTGPHLHFTLSQNGKYINPLQVLW